MQTFKKMAFDANKLEQMQIIEDSKCCLKVRSAISKAGVYLYDDGWALKPATELLKATRTAKYAKLTLHDHPSTKVIMTQNDLYGGVEQPYFDRDKIRAILNFDKYRTSLEIQQKIRDAVAAGTGLDVSIGFYYIPDYTPGKASDVNTGEMRQYDYVMRDIVIDHVAVMFDGKVRGRCTFPNCGIGVDGIMKRIEIGLDKVVQRGDQWCVVHCHGEEEDEVIKCFDTKEEAEAMHKAIQAQKYASTAETIRDIAHFVNLQKLDSENWKLLFGADNEKPPKDWMESCMSKAESFADDPGAFCTWLYNSGSEVFRQGFGASVSKQKGGGKPNVSEAKTKHDYGASKMTQEEIEAEFNKCVKERMEEGMTQGEAEAHCLAATKPSDEPAPPPGIAAKKEKDQQEPNPEEGEKTPLERCIASQMEQGKSEEEARVWCEDELAGKHESTDSVLNRSKSLMEAKAQRDVERLRQQRRTAV